MIVQMDKIMQGDCIAVMQGFPDKAFDWVMTDPPYNAGYDLPNDRLTDEQYYQFTQRWVAECERVSRSQAYIITPKYCPVLYKIPKNVYFHTYVHHKSNAIRAMRGGFQNTNFVIVYHEGPVYKVPEFPNDVWNIPLQGEQGDVGHPTPKPMKLLEVMICKFTHGGQRILDPFVGFGTTAIVAKRLGRRYVGIELDKRYYNIARRNISQNIISELLAEGE